MQGENIWAKQKLFAALCKNAAKYDLPYTRVLHAHDAAQTVAVYLDRQHRFAADADYFSALAERHPQATRCTVPPFVNMPPDADAERRVLCACAAQANARADTFLQSAAQARADAAELLGEYIDRPRVCRAVFEAVNAVAPYAEKQHGKVLCRRAVSGITAWGVHTVYNPFRGKALRTAVFQDVYGGVAPVFLQGLCAACTEIGFDVQWYTAPLSDAPAHLVLPSCGIAFFTENDLHPFPFRADGVLGASRFVKRSAVRAVLPLLETQQAAAAEALECAVFSLFEAEEARSALLRLYEERTDRAALAAAEKAFMSAFFDFQHFAEN